MLVASLPAPPTALAFTPDGRILVTEQHGRLRVVRGGALVATPALSLGAGQLCSNNERGVLGVAVDPQFAANRWIYLFYTHPPTGDCAAGAVNRVSRFTLGDDDLVAAGSELVLLDGMPSPSGFHNAGDVQVGRDGHLYVSSGDGGLGGGPARNLNTLSGKVLRIARDGGIPADNPFVGAGTQPCSPTGGAPAGMRCREIFATGFRNPFRLAFDPNAAGTRFFVNDVGQGTWEEIDLGQAGGDFGWNCREGAHPFAVCSPPVPPLIDPLFEYRHGEAVPGTTSPTNCNSITGGAFVPGSVWPGYEGAYLFADVVCGEIFHLSAGPPFTAADFASGLGTPIHLAFGPHGVTQALYYTTFPGQVRRITFDAAGNEAPVAAVAAAPSFGPLPLAVAFDGAASTDPDPGDTLTYFWDFGDGSPPVETPGPSVMHTYTTAAVRTATLRVRDQLLALSAPATVEIQAGNTPPVPTIQTPAPTDRFAVGETVFLTGSATDPEDGALGDAALRWTVVLHHNDHVHPFLGPVAGNGIAITGPAPEDLEATEASYLEVRLAAVDASGLAGETSRDFEPRRVPLRFEAVPSGLAITLRGVPFATPADLTSWEGWALEIGAPAQTGPGGATFVFDSWSDGGAATHTVVTPAGATTLVATFVDSALRPLDYFTLPPCRLVDTRDPDGPRSGPVLLHGALRRFVLPGVCGLPATARSVALNLTIVTPTGAGHLQLFPGGSQPPASSVLNFAPGQTRANNAVLGLAGDGSLDAVLAIPGGGSAHLLLDVVGYFE